MNNEYRKIRLVENMLIASPFVFFLALQHFFILSLTALICGMLSSLYNEWGKSSFVIFSPFSKEPFEFTVGFRKSYWLLAILYILTIISISVGNFNLGVAALLGVMLVCMNFYSITEPIFYVWIYTQQPKYFLIGKVKTAMLYSISLVLPLMILLSVFYPAKVFIILGITLIGLLYIAMSVVAKYTNYPAQINLLQIIKLGAGVIFPPFMLIIIPHFYLQSIRKLNVYLK
ncbi:hypothetical protein HDF18_17035 [Mucilaginibacter sp. X5P1]|uniref:ABC transporter permease n=1 Tax=Mucilaginibacter sp. X5P1 TaxID=2723088 RepID=UPI0016072125|nr:ABC transporter permease [Mucilaginibacter sp. X5P1]MBB6139342.1 hypothetical protein [Mucilaginibacter sp. X5P1]